MFFQSEKLGSYLTECFCCIQHACGSSDLPGIALWHQFSPYVSSVYEPLGQREVRETAAKEQTCKLESICV